MKNILKALPIFLIIAVVLIFTFSCNSGGKANDSSINNYIDKSSKEFKKFMEKCELASNSARINLAPIISDMQDIKSEFEGIEIPGDQNDLQNAKNMYIEGMELVIEGFMSFQTQKSQKEMAGLFNGAQEKFDNAEALISIYDKEGKFKSSKLNIRYEIKTADVKYIVIGTLLSEVDVAYKDENGLLVEKTGLKLSLSPKAALEGIQTSLGDRIDENAEFNIISDAAIVAEIGSFPLDYTISFGAMHNENGNGMITVIVAINNVEWKIKSETVRKGIPVTIDEKYTE